MMFRSLVELRAGDENYERYMSAKQQIFSSLLPIRKKPRAKYKFREAHLDKTICVAFVAQKMHMSENVKAKGDSQNHPAAHRLTYFHRAAWAILTHRDELAMVFLNQCEREDGPQIGMALAMMMRMTYRSLVNENVTYTDALVSSSHKVSEKISDMMSKISQDASETWYLVDFIFEEDGRDTARAVMSDCDSAKHFFGRHKKKETLLDLAMFTGCKEFVAHPVVQGFLDTLWNQR